MTKTKFNIDWSSVDAFIMTASVIVAGCLLIAWVFQASKQASEQEIQNMNTEARCKSLGGERGYSKCYKDGKEV